MDFWGHGSVRAGVVVLSVLTSALMATPALAQACPVAGSLDRSGITDSNPAPDTTIVSVTTDLEGGTQIDFTVVLSAGDGFLDIHVDASPGGAQNGLVLETNAPGPGSGSFTPLTTGSYTFNYVVMMGSVETTGSVTATCGGGGGGGPPKSLLSMRQIPRCWRGIPRCAPTRVPWGCRRPVYRTTRASILKRALRRCFARNWFSTTMN